MIKARTSTPSILENLEGKYNGECRLIAREIMNMRQKYRQKQRGGIPEIEALIRNLQDDGAIFRTKVSLESHITHLLVIPNSIPHLVA